jgi:glutamate/tyrosine decarboxylase-like PLP-dependent enzyme
VSSPVTDPREEGSRRRPRRRPRDCVRDEQLLAYLRALIFEQSVYIGHPGFMAYICGAGTVPSPVADLLAAGVNQNLGGWRISPGATEVELQCTRWLAACLGLPETAGGHFVTGGALANLIGLKAARDAALPGAVEHGVQRPLAIYASEEAHAVIAVRRTSSASAATRSGRSRWTSSCACAPTCSGR